MKQFLCSIYFLSIVATGSTQMTSQYARYCENINNAELKAIDGYYGDALSFYKKAFHYHSVFAKDYYNAAVCAMYHHDAATAKKYLKEVKKKGYSGELLKQDSLFTELISRGGSLWLDRLKPNTGDLQTKMKLDSMVYWDQFYRKKAPRTYSQSIWRDTIRTIDSTNVINLIKIIETVGFPSEFSLSIADNRLTDFPWYVLLIHQQNGSSNRFFNFGNFILSAMQQGKILPHRGAVLYTLSFGRDSLFSSGGIFSIKEAKEIKYYYLPLDSAKEELTNRRRKEYGLETLAEYRKKLKYFVTRKDLKFGFKMGENIESIDAEDAQKYFRNLIELK